MQLLSLGFALPLAEEAEVGFGNKLSTVPKIGIEGLILSLVLSCKIMEVFTYELDLGY